ncbi:MAG: hypothetical protein H6983_15910 [Ectothiorhodospiraceae bacterium]|nr:hypothetical protein [Chromatiales bacterium]MCP5155657.1 hypothetical protein [Ectothiorhodospiraceae bacterium]
MYGLRQILGTMSRCTVIGVVAVSLVSFAWKSWLLLRAGEVETMVHALTVDPLATLQQVFMVGPMAVAGGVLGLVVGAGWAIVRTLWTAHRSRVDALVGDALRDPDRPDPDQIIKADRRQTAERYLRGRNRAGAD